MRLDPVINQRFEALCSEGEDIGAKMVPHPVLTGKDVLDQARVVPWDTSCRDLISRAVGRCSEYYKKFVALMDSRRRPEDSASFGHALELLRRLHQDWRSGYFTNIRAMVTGEACSDTLNQAEELLTQKYTDAACILCGAALETALRELGRQHGVSSGKFNEINIRLRQKGIYAQPDEDQHRSWYGRRNDAAHGDLGKSTEQDVRNMLEGVRRFIGTRLT
ncbi:MAG: hypothetical protein HY321_14040 [Armatimonadetes bacterium]|nr:hypothetical protein [Armatimonadota bacterium]